MQTKPRDFTTGLFKFRSTPSEALPLDRDLYRTLSQGVHGTSMIPQTHLSADDRWAVIQYLKGFSAWFVTENPAEPVQLGRMIEVMNRMGMQRTSCMMP